MTDVFTLADIVSQVVEDLKVFSDEKPDLIPTGFRALDNQIGGVDPGTASLLLADQHVGKTHTILHAARNAPSTTGIISLEDGPIILGSREIARACGIDPLKLRRKDLTPTEMQRLRDYLDSEQGASPFIMPLVGASATRVYEGIEQLAESGCRLIWVDYAQKMRGLREDRNNEVATFFTNCQSAAAKHGAALFMASQVTGVSPNCHPGPWNSRESRDLANEARLILSIKQPEPGSKLREYRVWKSSFGSVGQLSFELHFDECGTLREMVYEAEEF